MFSLFLRRPLFLVSAFLLLAIVGGVYVRVQQRNAMAQMYPWSSPEAQEALRRQVLDPSDPTAALRAQMDPSQINASDMPPGVNPQVMPASMSTPASPANGSSMLMGIPSEALDVTYSSQRNSMWCWAASIQMVLQYHGIRTVQQDIVARTFGPDAQGNLPNKPGDLKSITANLNNFNVDRAGTTYQVESIFGEGAPPVSLLLDEMDRREPLIIGYRSGPNMGHAVVITGVVYSQTAQGPMIHKIIVRDPWPSDENRATNGRVEYDAREFAPKIQGYWKVRVRQ